MYKEYLPCHILAPYVDRYWEFKGQTEQGMQIKLSTDGCTDFMFILESTVNHGIMMQPYHSYFIGPMNICSTLITSSGTINTFGVRFRPCGLSRFMKISLSELTNIRLSVNDLDTIFIYSFAEKTILPYIHTKLPDVRQHLWPFLLLIPIFSCPAPSPAQGLRYIRPDHR